MLQVRPQPVCEAAEADGDEEVDGETSGARVVLGEEAGEGLGEGGVGSEVGICFWGKVGGMVIWVTK